jgi:hypothetical protein
VTDYYVAGLSLSPAGIFASGPTTIPAALSQPTTVTAALNQQNASSSPIAVRLKTNDNNLAFSAPQGTAPPSPAGCGVILAQPGQQSETATAAYNGALSDSDVKLSRIQ